MDDNESGQQAALWRWMEVALGDDKVFIGRRLQKSTQMLPLFPYLPSLAAQPMDEFQPRYYLAYALALAQAH